MRIGLAGYSGSGVTTLLALLSEDAGLAGRHAGPEIRAITVDDPRFQRLVEFFNPKKVTPLKVDVMELGDLRPDEGGGLRKETLSRAAGLDAFVLVLRGFSAPMSSLCRPGGDILSELESLMQEFCIADLMPVENRLERLGKEGKLSSREARLFDQIKTGLEEGCPVRRMGLDSEEMRSLSGYNLLTLAPLMVLTNLGSECIGEIKYPELLNRCGEDDITYLETSTLAELETLEIPEEERQPFLADLGLEEPTRKRFIKALFKHLRLSTFFTVGEKEVRAWTISEGTTAVKAAGKIHSDIERGFIRAEVISVDECLELGGLNKAKETGKLRVEGKDYLLKDGEIFHVRFNV
jgi:ribosome-binding ATPase YchF (GTP1/OBG family)